MRRYERPLVRDLGDLEAITRATGFTNTEDGGNKLVIHHYSPASDPAGP
jgi:hypothetical protein